MTKLTIQNKKGEVLKTLDVSPESSLLGQIEAVGVEIPNACRTGMCGACMCQIESGDQYIVKDSKWEPAFPLWDDEVMTCIGWVKDTDSEIILKTMY